MNAENVTERARELFAMPSGAEVWQGWHGWTKRTRGDWTQIASGPERATSWDLAVLGY